MPIRCDVSKSALLDITLNELPDVIIICANDESVETVRAFDVPRESTRLGTIEIIVIATDEDRKMFMANSELSRFFFLARPVSLLALYRKLEEFEISLKDNARAATLEEYINTREREVFKRKHILVVDDDPEQLLMIKEHLKEFYEVTVINGGKMSFGYWKNIRWI